MHDATHHGAYTDPENRTIVQPPQPTMFPFKRTGCSSVLLVLLGLMLGLVLCGGICIVGPLWVLHQWQQGVYYGYISIDDPNMTHPQHVGDTVKAGSMRMTLHSLRQVGEGNSAFLIIHVTFEEQDTTQAAYHVDSPGSLVVYTNPVFDPESHHYTGERIDASGRGMPLPQEVSSPLNLETSLNPGERIEGDCVFKIPVNHSSLVPAWIPDETEQFTWTV